MAGKSTRWIWIMMMIVSLTSTAVFSQSLGSCLDGLNGLFSSISTLSGTICNESNTLEQLAGTTQAFFTCPSNGGSDIVIQKWDKYSSTDGTVQENIQNNSPKYGTSTDRLQISNIEPDDEGAYVCTLMVDGGNSRQALGGCLVIYGKAEFVTNDAMLDITVNRGENIVFDTALEFRNGGSCGLNQTISILQLQKIGVGDVVDCANLSPCQLDTNFAYSAHGNITKSNATVEDEGRYRLGVSVEDPQTDVLQRTFNVMVTDNPTPSVAGPTQSPASTSASSTTHSSSTTEGTNNPTPSVAGPTQSPEVTSDEYLVAIVVPLAVILVIAMVVIYVMVLYIWFKLKRSQKMAQNSIEMQEPNYEHVSNVHPSNGSGRVNIVDDSGYHELMP